MAAVEVLMPKMGESITDATIIKWHKKVGDTIADEETLLEVATDKVDSEIPSPVSGVITEVLYKEDDVVDIGAVIAMIETSDKVTTKKGKKEKSKKEKGTEETITKKTNTPLLKKKSISLSNQNGTNQYYSPLVKSIAKKEGIPLAELDSISGSGAKGRITKSDIIQYIEGGRRASSATIAFKPSTLKKGSSLEKSSISETIIVSESGDEIIVMDRMRKLIADHMVQSKKISPHVTSFAEADVTKLFDWRSKVKDAFQEKYNIKLTLTPIIIEIVAKALRLHPKLNSSVIEDKMVVKKNINIGMATALPSGNLIVPVIHNADQFNLNGLAMKVNDKVDKARANNLSIEEIQDGTFTLTNIGSYGSQLGTPIINQPEVAILATGAIKKKPVVIESPDGDAIGIRKMMYLSMSYDHRVIDGYLGGTFLQTVIQLLENFDENREI